MLRLCVNAVAVCLLGLGSGHAAESAAAATGRLLFRDPFESTSVRDGVTVTQPAAVEAGKASGPAGRMSGPVNLGEGKDARGAKLSGLSQIRYEPVTGISPASPGACTSPCWAALSAESMRIARCTP